MRIRSPFELSLTDEDRAALEVLVRKGTAQYRRFYRCQGVFAASFLIERLVEAVGGSLVSPPLLRDFGGGGQGRRRSGPRRRRR
jgi:hypothetical protein